MDIKAFTRIKRENMELFKKFIEEGQAEGIFRKNVNIELIPATIMGTLIHFQMNQIFFEQILGLNSEEAYENYIKNELTAHLKQTIKALLLYEN